MEVLKIKDDEMRVIPILKFQCPDCGAWHQTKVDYIICTCHDNDPPDIGDVADEIYKQNAKNNVQNQ